MLVDFATIKVSQCWSEYHGESGSDTSQCMLQHIRNVDIQDVLRGFLYPEVHDNKPQRKSVVEGK